MNLKDLKDFFNEYKNQLIQYLKSFKLLKIWLEYIEKKHRWVNASLLNYSIFWITGSISFSIIRFIQMWITNSFEEYSRVYYISVGFSFTVSFLAIVLRFLTDKGWIQGPRVELNKKKWCEYEDLLIKNYNLRWNIIFSKCLIIICVFHSWFLYFYRDNHTGESLSNFGMFFFSLVIFFYILNRLYIAYCMYKTPFPDELLLEPPVLYERILSLKPIDNILKRHYSTRADNRLKRIKMFYTSNRKAIWAGAVSAAGAALLINNTDRALGDLTGQTTYAQRGYTSSAYGWDTLDPKIKRRAEQLQRWGVDVKELRYGSSKILDSELVNELYEAERERRYSTPLKREVAGMRTEIQVLKSAAEEMQARTEEMQARTEEMQLELEELRRYKETTERSSVVVNKESELS